MSAPRSLEVDAAHAGQRLDAFLAEQIGVTHGYARRLLTRGRVRLAGRTARKGVRLRAGDRIELGPLRHPSEGLLPAPEIELAVLAESQGMVALDKPAGLPTHPLDFDETATAANAFLARYPSAASVGPRPLEPGLLHRLDTDTSGVLLFATVEAAWQRAHDAFRSGHVRKLYRARVHGALDAPIELHLELAHRGRRMKVVPRGGQPTQTRVRPIAVGYQTSHVEIEIPTGVRHQIRASLAHVGHPVVGDALYGSPTALPRHLLHAHELHLPGFEAQSPLPDAIREDD